jgi:hypothetical protein
MKGRALDFYRDEAPNKPQTQIPIKVDNSINNSTNLKRSVKSETNNYAQNILSLKQQNEDLEEVDPETASLKHKNNYINIDNHQSHVDGDLTHKRENSLPLDTSVKQRKGDSTPKENFKDDQNDGQAAGHDSKFADSSNFYIKNRIRRQELRSL